jgi:hypothetical protein
VFEAGTATIRGLAQDRDVVNTPGVDFSSQIAPASTTLKKE